MNKKIFISAILILTAIMLSSCVFNSIEGSGNIVTITKDYEDFNKIKIGNSFDVMLTQADEYNITIKIDDNIIDYLEIENKFNTLDLSLEDENNYRHVTLKAEITLPDIKKVKLSGASDANISGFDLDHSITIDLSGASDLTGSLNTGNVKIDLSGASEVKLSGTGNDLDIDASGASDVKMGNFIVDDADVDLSGASSAKINMNGILNANLSGASSLRYYGNPTIGSINTSGASSAKPLD